MARQSQSPLIFNLNWTDIGVGIQYCLSVYFIYAIGCGALQCVLKIREMLQRIQADATCIGITLALCGTIDRYLNPFTNVEMSETVESLTIRMNTLERQLAANTRKLCSSRRRIQELETAALPSSRVGVTWRFDSSDSSEDQV